MVDDGYDMERFGDRIGEYYSTWLAISISCCFPRSQERPQSYVEEEVEEEMTLGRETTTVPIRAKTIKRQSPIPGRQSSQKRGNPQC